MSPDVRLGQLLAHLGFLGEDQTGRTLWDIDDEQLLAVLYHHREELMARRLKISMGSELTLEATISGEIATEDRHARSRSTRE
jgi:hypothetical protein